MKKTLRRKMLVLIAFLLLVCAAAVYAILRLSPRILSASVPAAAPTLVIDAGHGGIDGGAISQDGTRESELNLSIALRLESIVRFCGQKTMMTRWDEGEKTDILSYSEREDLKTRAELVNSLPNAVLISIHQNDFPTAQPKGAQVLYSAYGDSEKLALLMQGSLVSRLDPENRRLAAPAPRELYLTSHTRCPAVLVECGFMSNNFEVEKLKDTAYQNALALVIAASYLEYISGETSS